MGRRWCFSGFDAHLFAWNGLTDNIGVVSGRSTWVHSVAVLPELWPWSGAALVWRLSHQVGKWLPMDRVTVVTDRRPQMFLADNALAFWPNWLAFAAQNRVGLLLGSLARRWQCWPNLQSAQSVLATTVASQPWLGNSASFGHGPWIEFVGTPSHLVPMLQGVCLIPASLDQPLGVRANFARRADVARLFQLARTFLQAFRRMFPRKSKEMMAIREANCGWWAGKMFSDETVFCHTSRLEKGLCTLEFLATIP